MEASFIADTAKSVGSFLVDKGIFPGECESEGLSDESTIIPFKIKLNIHLPQIAKKRQLL